jgi:hypothetical protein
VIEQHIHRSSASPVLVDAAATLDGFGRARRHWALAAFQPGFVLPHLALQLQRTPPVLRL